MTAQQFEVQGSFRIGEAWKPYTKVIEAPNERQAVERIFALFGSKHRLKRRDVRISGVSVVTGE